MNDCASVSQVKLYLEKLHHHDIMQKLHLLIKYTYLTPGTYVPLLMLQKIPLILMYSISDCFVARFVPLTLMLVPPALGPLMGENWMSEGEIEG